MKRVTNLLRGVVEIRAEGMFPERLINLCAQHRVEFWGVEWLDEHTITFTTARPDRKQVRELGEKIGCTVTTGGGRGMPFFLARFRRRYACLVGLFLSLVCVTLLSNVIFTIDVEGAQAVPAAQVLGELRRQGLRPGVYGPGLDLNQMVQEAMLELDEVAWMTINLHGTRAQVIVREVVEKPELIEDEGCCDVVAEADGLITQLEVYAGQAQVKEGDTVMAGELLISGTVAMKPPDYSDQPVRYYQTWARGKIMARTWRTLEAKIPLTTTVKSYTGDEKRRYGLVIFGYPVDFYRNSSISWPFYDKIKTVYPLPGGEGQALPVAWVKEVIRGYELQRAEIDPQAAQTMLEEELSARLEKLVGETGKVKATRTAAKVKNGWLYVTLNAECEEEVGRERPAEESAAGA